MNEKGHLAWRQMAGAAMKIIYSPQGSKALLGMMKQNADNPPLAVAQAAAIVLQHIMSQIKGMDPRLAITTAPAILMLLFELGNKAGIFKADLKMMPAALKALHGIVGGGAGPAAGPAAPAAPAGPAPGGLVGGAMQPQAAAMGG
jgi:hypothetical protein